MNTGKPNGRPPKTDRNAKIIAEVAGGKSCKQVAGEMKLSIGYVQKISSEYHLKRKQKNVVANSSITPDLFTGMDLCLWIFVAGLKGKKRKHTPGNDTPMRILV